MYRTLDLVPGGPATWQRTSRRAVWVIVHAQIDVPDLFGLRDAGGFRGVSYLPSPVDRGRAVQRAPLPDPNRDRGSSGLGLPGTPDSTAVNVPAIDNSALEDVC